MNLLCDDGDGNGFALEERVLERGISEEAPQPEHYRFSVFTSRRPEVREVMSRRNLTLKTCRKNAHWTVINVPTIFGIYLIVKGVSRLELSTNYLLTKSRVCGHANFRLSFTPV